MSSKYLIIASSLLVLPHAQAAEPAFCGTALNRLSDERQIRALSLEDPDTVVLEVGALEAKISGTPKASMTGGVLLRQGEKLAGADSARYDPENKALLLDGSVRYEDAGTLVESNSAEFSYGLGLIRFEGARFSLAEDNAHGAADALEVNQQGRLELDGVSYTTCPPESNDWVIEAKSIDLDTRSGVGTARGIQVDALRFYYPVVRFRRAGRIANTV
ncbi:MAG: hypothetical protein GWP02_08115, partial [Desulfobulbaceae bacterium]|nr:hypothetical protein [Desulfobulbaceae bacterium]